MKIYNATNISEFDSFFGDAIVSRADLKVDALINHGIRPELDPVKLMNIVKSAVDDARRALGRNAVIFTAASYSLLPGHIPTREWFSNYLRALDAAGIDGIIWFAPSSEKEPDIRKALQDKEAGAVTRDTGFDFLDGVADVPWDGSAPTLHRIG